MVQCGMQKMMQKLLYLLLRVCVYICCRQNTDSKSSLGHGHLTQKKILVGALEKASNYFLPSNALSYKIVYNFV